MSNKEVQKFFDERSASYIRLAKWATNEKLLSATISILQGIKAEKVVELGCGNGLLLNYFKQSSCRIGIDISRNMLLAIEDTDIQKIQADIHNVPIANHSVDLVLCRQVLQYCQPAPVIHETQRILKRGGFLHIAQLTDYDEIPDEWYEFWVGLRGVKGRKRLSRQKLLEYTANANYIVLKEESCYVSVQHKWSDFFEKNKVSLERHDEVKSFFRNAAPETKQTYHLIVNNDGLSYVRRFSLFLLATRSKKIQL